MESCCHWLTELAEVYARHAGRHGPNRLLPAEVLPTHGCVPEPKGSSPQGSGSDGRMAGHTTADGVHMHTDRRDEGACDGPRGKARIRR